MQPSPLSISWHSDHPIKLSRHYSITSHYSLPVNHYYMFCFHEFDCSQNYICLHLLGTITKYHKLHVLWTTKNYFSQPKIKALLVRVHNLCSLAMSSHDGRNKGTNTINESNLIPQRSHFLLPLTWGLAFQHMH
jgi:hypothetical protein